MNYRSLRIVGTSHIAQQSLKDIETAFIQHKPAFVAVELDRRRLHSLFSEEKHTVGLSAIGKIGLKGWMFATVGGWLQRKLGNVVGMKPGGEMKRAVELAKQTGAKIALIDQDIEVTLRKFSARLSWREKFRFLGDLLKSFFFKKKAMKEIGLDMTQFDLSKVPDKVLVQKLIAQLEKRYPNVYDVLVRERNVIMANNLAKLMHQFPDEPVLAVVGAGHEEEIMHLVKKRMEGKVDVVK
ncbi:TraB/GumN family protein [Candidatus Woesearchaeota archaeon]|nr:TraB/GumN family protein [Candidatus Woesearchaeota archaeon]